jgi:ribose transport system permease protein
VWSRLGLLVVNVVFWVVFTGAAPAFVSDYNLFTLLRFVSIQIVVGFSQMVMFSAGEMNLAVGSIGAVVALFAGGLMQVLGLPPLLAVAAGLSLALVAGAFNGFLEIRTGINSFIITLATSSMFSGLMFITTKAKAYDALPASFVEFGRMRVFGLALSPLVLVMLAVAVFFFFMYRNTSFGREVLAVGANRRAAAMSGVPVSRVIVLSHMLSAATAGLAGIMMAAYLGSAVPVIGQDWLLPSCAAPAIGGTLLSGGVVSVFGAVMGGLLIGSITNGLLLLNVSNFWLYLFLGLVLLIAVVLDRIRILQASRHVGE